MTSSSSPTSFYSSQLSSTMTSSCVWTPSTIGRQSVDDNGGNGQIRNADPVADVTRFSLITPLSTFDALQSVTDGRLREYSNADVVGSSEKKITRFTIDAILGNDDDGDNHVDKLETDEWRLSQSVKVKARISRESDRLKIGGGDSNEEMCNEHVIGTVDGLDVVQMAAADSADSGLVRGWHSDSTCAGDSVCPECHSTDGVTQRNDVDSRTPSNGAGKQTKRVRTIYTQEQLDRLEREFVKQQYMVGAERYYLAVQLGLVEAQVKVWFQNRRIKWRRQAIEAQRQSLSSSSSSSTSSRYHRQHGRQQQSQRRPAVSVTTYRECHGADQRSSDLYPSTHVCFRRNTVNRADDICSASISTFPFRSSSAAFDLDTGVTMHSVARRQTVSGIADSCSEDLDLVTSGFGDVAGDCVTVDMRISRLDRTFPTINS